jgi:hypothetical protein
MAQDILLTSEDFVKSMTNISDNIAAGYLLPSIREAQEQGLRGIVGDCLLTALKGMVANGSFQVDPIPEDAVPYRDLLDRAQYYLAYKAVAELLNKVSYKVGNFGVAKSNDENLAVVTQDEIAKQIYYYQSKADGCCRGLQRWILQNRASFPELRDCDCASMQANLTSSATCGIFLGGARGRKLPGGGGCC